MSENTNGKRGRPVNPNAIKTLFINAEGKVHGRGRLANNGAGYIKVHVHRSVKPAEYVHGVTPTVTVEVAPEIPEAAAPVPVPDDAGVVVAPVNKDF